jgi:hypothetical protein
MAMEKKPQNDVRRADEFDRDLHPDPFAGQNIGTDTDREVGLRSAYDVKSIHRALGGMSDDELKQVPILPEGQRLRQGATYLDLRDPARGELTATGDMAAERGSAYVAKDQVPYETWNRLRGIDDPRRT